MKTLITLEGIPSASTTRRSFPTNGISDNAGYSLRQKNYKVKFRAFLQQSELYALGKREALKLLSLLNEEVPGMATKKELLKGLKWTARDQTEEGGRWHQSALKRVIYME